MQLLSLQNPQPNLYVINFTFYIKTNKERVSVQTTTLVTFWYVWQMVCRFEHKLFVQFCFHLDSQALKKTGNTKEFAAKRQALPLTSVAKTAAYS
ncbi:hypothetical protein HC02_30580 [Vibrio parahaemolyticus]|nr:hypothetical protein HC02_30580 [Vibrio parahaemolyticus]